MFTLFKNRDFGDYISDTFQFFKITGKHYFKHYFTLTGGLLMVLVVISYFLFQVYFDFFLKMSTFNSNNSEYLINYMSNNVGLIIGIAFFVFAFFLFLSMLNYAIPVIYLNLYDTQKGPNFGSKDIFKEFKAKLGKITKFFLITAFVITPVLMVFFMILILLCFLLIGIPLLLIAIPAVFSWIALSFYEYINHDKGYFESLGNGFKSLKRQFFPIVGATFVMYVIIQITMSVFTMIPYSFGIASVMTHNTNGSGATPVLNIMLTIVMVISMLMSFILNNLLVINQGLAYYSGREFSENISSTDSIDLIGSE